MTIGMQPIFTQTVGSGGTSTLTFNNIPQTFTDLSIQISARNVYTGDADSYMWFNGSQGTAYSWTKLQGSGNLLASYRGSNTDTMSPFTQKGNVTANSFGTANIYIPNYTSSNFKSVISESVTENADPSSYTTLASSLWRNTAAITSISFTTYLGFVQYSTFSLYGITKG